MLTSLFSSSTVTLPDVLLMIGLALALGTLSALFHRKMNHCSQSMFLTLACLPLITSTVILVVNGNLGAGIAIAGSFSLIRFRSAQGTGSEILALFLSASLGLCLGAGYWAVAVILLLAYMLLMLFLRALPLTDKPELLRELRITVPESLDYEGLFDDVLKEHFSAYSLDRVKTADMGSTYQLLYTVTKKAGQEDKACLDAIRIRNGNLPVSLGRIPERSIAM